MGRHAHGIEPEADIYAQRVNAYGVVQWTANGVAISTASLRQDDATIVSDGSGGAIVAFTTEILGNGNRVYAQRVNAGGTPQWTPNGLDIFLIVSENPSLPRTGRVARSSRPSVTKQPPRVSLPTFTPSASPRRAPCNGQAAASPSRLQTSFQRYIAIMDDGAGGALLAWRDDGSSTVRPST
jgi:hypothetical protein